MLPDRLDQIDASYLHRLRDEKWSESGTLDFKRDLPGNSERDKQEILKDVCAFANTDGGDLIYGIDDTDGVATAVVPFTNEPPDAAKRRILQVLDGIEPRIHGLQVRAIPVDQGHALIIRVPASFQAPHSFRVNSARRFVNRNGTTTSDLTMDQLRSAFDRTATLAEKAQHFINWRLQEVGRGAGPKKLGIGPISTVILVPIAGVASRRAVDLQALHKNYAHFLGTDWGGGSRTFNLDGLTIHPSPDEQGRHGGYVQVFRNGSLEAVEMMGGQWEFQAQPVNVIYDMTPFFRGRTKGFLAALRDWGFTGPAILSFALLRVPGYSLATHARSPGLAKPQTDRDNYIMPTQWIDDIEAASLDDVVRPLLDNLWQGFGMDRCLDFDPKSGAFTPR